MDIQGINTIFRIAAVGMITAIINSILEKSDKKEVATFVTLGGLLIVLVMIVDMVVGLFGNLRSIFNLI